MTLYTVTFTTLAVVEVYGGLDALDAYLFTSASEGAAAYRDLTAGGDDRKRLLVDATRYLDRRRWKGTANAAGGTTLAFPRDDLLTVEGDAASNAYQLDRVSRAAFELVALAAVDASVLAEADAGSNVKKLDADGTSIEFFSATSPRTGTASSLPTALEDLLGMWLLGGGAGVSVASLAVGGSSSGVCDRSIFDGRHGHRRRNAF